MADLVVTVPKWFWPDWIAEGDAAGDPETGETWGFTVGARSRPPIEIGDRLYIVAHDRLRGWAPVVMVEPYGRTRYEIGRRGGAVACTIPERIPGFRGWRRVWWDRGAELPFPDWRVP
jgi:hypothetical protein